MKFRLQRVAIGLMAISMGFLTVSCNESKVSQCANVIKVVNQTVTETKTITASGTNGELPTIEKLVESFDKAAKEMEATNVSDDKLKTYKSQFLAMYQGAATINKQLVASIKSRKLTEVNQGLRKSRDNFSPERDLATGLTQYCKEPEKK
jgi:hypothetical protein